MDVCLTDFICLFLFIRSTIVKIKKWDTLLFWQDTKNIILKTEKEL